ncbi:TetR family transcriptional regulator C-terminal domain-containing protein [Streptomyces sp. NPDC002809]|uniref:TetR family transcriptional regulator C-terminal domain-containing protein n=1 Tax=Streptomyces sp. NPDC002809 TaxID=3154433 RepID=UPI00333277EB
MSAFGRPSPRRRSTTPSIIRSTARTRASATTPTTVHPASGSHSRAESIEPPNAEGSTHHNSAARASDPARVKRLPIRDVVTDGLAEWLPVDPPRRSAHRVAPAFVGRTVDSPRLAHAHAETGHLIRSMLSRAVHNGKECGEVLDDTNPELAALELHSLVEGLALQLGFDATADDARTSLDLVSMRVQAVFPGRCRQYE